jgi:hypothetical protein
LLNERRKEFLLDREDKHYIFKKLKDNMLFDKLFSTFIRPMMLKAGLIVIPY